MKKFLFVITLLLSTRFGFAQVMGGGRGNNSPSPQEVKAAELTKGAYNSDVNLFTGGLSTSYTLGTVSTPSGLSYTLSMSYSSAFSVGDNAPLCKGIGYGEGWNLNLPTISVSTETYSKYSQTQMANFNQLGNDNLYPTFNGGEAANEGKTFWMAPEINIPGVVSDRFVYKFTDNEGELVFVPSRFDSYVEARLKDNAWRVIINDGTVYEFGVSAVNVRNASNQRYLVENSYPGPLWMDADDFFAGNNNIQPTTITYGIGAYTVYGGKRYVCIANVLYGSHNASKPTNSSYWTFVEDVNYTPNMPYSDVYTPKFEYLNWTVSKIYHPNYPNGQQIQFIYENYGAFNFFSEYLQNNFVKAIGNYTNNFTVYKDQYLKTVRSLENFGNDYIEKIDLKYKTEYPDPAVYPNPESSLSLLMLPGQDDVFRKDSLYNYKVVYSTGLEGTDAALIDPSNTSLTNTTSQNFDNWARYYHVRSDEVQSHIGVVNTDMVGTNPYVLSGTTTPTDGGWVDYNPSGVNETMYRTLTEADDLPFDHCFLESPKIGYNSTFMPAGDIYEIRTLISNTNSDKYCNFDINVVAGLKNPNEPLTGNETAPGSSIEDLNHNLYQRNRHTTLFTTFNQAVKWNTIPINSSGNGRVISSNFFTMPNLPADFEGFRIQVGPGNSDQNFACYGSAGYNIKYPIDVNSTTPNAYRAYFNVINEPNAIAQLKTGCNSIPYNFGIGYEWHMMRKVASNMAGNLYNYNDSRYNKWWSFNGYNYWDNNPTLANENVNLHAVELIRYSKNPYMLSSVEVSRPPCPASGTGE